MSWYALPLMLSVLVTPIDKKSDDRAAKDLKNFQGSWQAVMMRNVDGRPATAEELSEIRLVVQGSKFTLTGKDFNIAGKFTIDPAKNPKTIDVVLDGSKKPDEKFLGLYEITKGSRKSCFALPGKARPVDLAPSASGFLVFEWKKVR